MKNTFKEFARPKTDELKRLWAEAIIIFDTNILLNLYEYSQSTRDSIFEIMENLKDQLWLPYKVGEEFYTKRISKIHTHNNSCGRAIELIDNLLKVDKESSLYELLHDNKQLKKLKREAEKISKQDKLEISNEPVVDRIERIYDGRVGLEPTEADIEEIEKEYRYKTTNGIYCPGFKDSDKGNNSSGDLHLWKQMLAYAVKNKTSIIFVTEDGKDDWWWKPQGVRISARYELLKEFMNGTNGKNFHMYKFKDFTAAYAKYKGMKIDKKVAEEIKNTEEEKNATRNILAEVLAGNSSDSEIYTNYASNIDILKGLEKYRKMINSYEKALKPLRDIQKHYETITAPLEKIQSLANPLSKYKSEWDKQFKQFEILEDKNINSLVKMLKSCSSAKDIESICKTPKDDE